MKLKGHGFELSGEAADESHITTKNLSNDSQRLFEWGQYVM